MVTPEIDLHEVFAATRAARVRSEEARKNLELAMPILSNAIRSHGHQGEKTREILKSLWNGETGTNEVGLCDVLAGLDHNLGEAILAAIAGRIFLSGDADALLRPLLEEIFAEQSEEAIQA